MLGLLSAAATALLTWRSNVCNVVTNKDVEESDCAINAGDFCSFNVCLATTIHRSVVDALAEQLKDEETKTMSLYLSRSLLSARDTSQLTEVRKFGVDSGHTVEV